jgi:hypothetical protein
MVGPREVIESYIADVAERLPLKGRADIACELHGLLSDDLCGRSKSACRPADETTARELVTDFGRPDSPPADFDTRWATYTEEFRAPRLPALLVAMMGNLVVLASIANKGRESRSVRRLGIALGLGGIAITTWCVVGGAMFVVEPLDTIARVVLALCVFFALIDLAKRLRGN